MHFDQTTRKLVAEGAAKPKEKGYTPSVKVTGEQLMKLTEFAKQDGIVLTKKGKDGKTVPDNGKLSQAVRLYTEAALAEFVQSREGS